MSESGPALGEDPALVAERRAEQLDRLVSRINGLLRDVTERLMRASSRGPTERAVCERIVETEPYDIACIGEFDVAHDRIVSEICVGSDGLGGEFTLNVDAGHPIAEALDTGTVTVSTESDILTGVDEDIAAIAAAPLSYGDRTYGVLVVGSVDPDALDDIERTVVEALGWTISIAIDAARSRRFLATDEAVELVFEIRDSAFAPVALSTTCECELSYEGTVFDADGAAVSFFTTDVSPARLLSVAETHPGIRETRAVTTDESGGLVEVNFGYDTFVKALAEQGAMIKALHVESGHGRLELDVPNAADPRSVVDWIRETYPDSELVVSRERKRPPTTKREFIAELDAELTDRQRMALELAYLTGYYDRTRTVTGDELAERMDISRTSFHNHRRAAERKVIGQFLNDHME